MLTIAPPGPRAITRAADCATTKAAVTLSSSSRSSTASSTSRNGCGWLLPALLSSTSSRSRPSIAARTAGRSVTSRTIARARPPRRLDLADQARELGRGPAQRDHLGARRGERQGAAPADAAPGAADQRDLAVEAQRGQAHRRGSGSRAGRSASAGSPSPAAPRASAPCGTAPPACTGSCPSAAGTADGPPRSAPAARSGRRSSAARTSASPGRPEPAQPSLPICRAAAYRIIRRQARWRGHEALARHRSRAAVGGRRGRPGGRGHSDMSEPPAQSHSAPDDYAAGLAAFEAGDWQAVLDHMGKVDPGPALARRRLQPHGLRLAQARRLRPRSACSTIRRSSSTLTTAARSNTWVRPTSSWIGRTTRAALLERLATACQRVAHGGVDWRDSCGEWQDLKAAYDAYGDASARPTAGQ